MGISYWGPIAMFAAPFVVFFVFMAKAEGVRTALMVYGISAVTCGWLVLAARWATHTTS